MNAIDIIIRAKDLASSTIDGVAKSTSRLKESFGSAVAASQKAALGLMAVATAAAGFIGYGAKVAADLESSRQGFITLLGSAEEADKTLAQIKKDAASTPFELPGLIKANQMLTSITKDGAKSEEILLNVGKALAAMGKGQPEMDRLIVNLQQIGAVGHASMLDIKQFAFAGIPIFDMLAKSTGKTGEALDDMISNGEVTFEMLTKMFSDAGSAGGQFADAFKNQAGTFNQLMSNMSDVIKITMADIVTSTGIFDTLKGAISGVVNFLTAHKEDIVAGIKAFMEFVKKNAPVVAGAILGILMPALLSLAGTLISMTVTLAPWAAAFALIGFAAQKAAEHFGGWGKLFDAIKGAVQGVLDKFKAFWSVISPVVNFIKNAFVSAFKSLWSVIQKDLFPALKRLMPLFKVIGIAIAAIVAINLGILIAGVWLFVKALTFAIKIISAVINFLADVGRVGWAVMQGIWNVVTIVWNAIYSVISFFIQAIIAYFNLVFSVWSAIWNGVSAVVSFVWGIIYAIISTYINIIIAVISGIIAVVSYVLAVIRGLFIVAWNFIYGAVIKPVMDKIAAVFQWLWANIIAPVWNAIKAGAQAVWGVISSVFNTVRGFVSSVFNSVRNAASSAWNGVKSIWNGAIGWFKGVFGAIGDAASGLTSGIKNAVSSGFEGAKNIVKSGVNWIIDKINGIIRGVNNTAGKLPGVPNIPEIPKFNTGVENFRGGLAYVHQGEVLTNLPKGTNVIPRDQVNSAMGGITIEKIIINTPAAADRFIELLDRRSELSSLGVPT